VSAEEFFVTPENVPAYLVRRGLVRPGEPLSVAALGGGVSNIVLRIEGGERRWVLKQSLGKLRVTDDWRSDRARIFREADAIEALRPVLGSAHLPQVVHVDRENFLFIMTAAPLGSVVWKESLMAGRRSDPAVAREAGRMLAQMINGSRAVPSLREKFWDGTVFDQLRVDPYYRATARRHPDLRPQFDELIGYATGVTTALVHGDYSPKNMLVSGGKIFLIDFECVHWGDPAFDAAFLVNHLFLKMFHQPQFASHYQAALMEFWDALATALGVEMRTNFERRTLHHLGGLMLARIDGKSPVEYIQDDRAKERVRGVAKRILVERPEELGEVVGMILGAIRETGREKGAE
jgi:5-methylthioribose kinase